MSDSTNEQSLDEYGPEYYAERFSIPYDRTAHWQNFFAIVAYETIRGLRPRRVLDAGCAMGLLVEQFWDRGVYCEGIDISEYAISKVRRDVKPYCSVGSLTTPIQGRFDLITCIEVLEHLRPDAVRPAVANLCAATDAILFSSTPSDFEEPTHYSVHQPIWWLELFSEFGFWPDARFDAGYITPYAMLLRKGALPSDDYLALFSEYIRNKSAFEAKASESRGLDEQLKTLRSQLDEQMKAFHSQQQQSALATQRAEQALTGSLFERDRLVTEVEHLRSYCADRDRLTDQVNALTSEKEKAQHTLQAVLESRAWRWAERCRVPLRKLRADFPRVHKVVRAVARTLVGRRKQQAGEVAQTNQPNDPPGPAGGAFRLLSAARATHIQPLRSLDDSYQRWIDEQEPSPQQLREQRQAAESADGPVFSIAVPVHRTDHSMLQACIQSVLDQTYPRWQLYVGITPDDDSKNRKFLSGLAKRDARVRLIELDENGGISSNTNAALALATGEFLALLDHDDTLAPFALFEVVSRLTTQPDADVLYSDHDYLDPENGLRCNPLFKPDWSPSIMFSANYITHLTVLRRSLLERIGPFDPATDGAQDWDLFLRATEQTRRISHIPKVLYHWRMHAGSTAHNDSAKNYAADAQLLAIGAHMERCGMNAEPEVLPNGLLHVRFRQPSIAKVSVIIPTNDRVDLLSRCISTLLDVTHYENLEILIVDNGSQQSATHEYFRSLENDGRIRILWHPGPFNYSSVNNHAAREATGELLLFLNNDVEITQADWLTELASWAQLAPVGIVGAKLLRANGTIQHAGVVLGMTGFAGHPFADGSSLTFGIAGSTGWYRDLLAVTGACMMMRYEVFDDIGGFDENFTLCGSDVDICLRAYDRGYRVVFNPFSELIHHERQTRGTAIPPDDFVVSLKRYRRHLLTGDPHWSPNLSLWSQEPTFRYRNQQDSLAFAEKHVESLGAVNTVARPASDEEALVGVFDCSEQQFEDLRRQNSLVHGFKVVKRLVCFIPGFEVPFYGGIYTILRFCHSWQRDNNVEIFFAVCGSADHLKMAERIRQVCTDVQDDHVSILFGIEQAAELPDADASLCTLWTTPYYALRHKNVGRRFYLIQDYEPAFYRAGSLSAIVESTYRMGLYGIANTISLKQMYETEYGGKATYFTPRINASVFYPAESTGNFNNPRKPLQVFCYGRPKHPRNAFELVAQAMRKLKAKLGNRVRIVSAGDAWQPSDYDLQGIVENLGLLSYEDTGRLYRESQVGVVMMLTRHPSYLPLELMASGCLAVSNMNAWTSWLLKDGENCLLSPATATALSDTVERALLDTSLGEKIRANALAMVRAEYLDWSSQSENVFHYLCDPEGALSREAEKDTKYDANWVTAPGS